MDTETLQQIISNGESMEVEFKQSFHGVQDVARIIAAFANTLGGILLLGIRDNGQIEGIMENLDVLQQKIAQSNATIHPAPLTTIEIHTIDKKKILAVIVHKTDASIFHSVEGVIYIRLGSTIQRLEGQSIVEFLRNRQILLFEETIETSATIDDIDI
ncbi:MAG: ATP-binding protein, partial [Euryarchaeota archaeon]|nr:ATP-binding protein [Euryarchaeota archaeon]